MIKIDLRVTRDIGDRMPENMYITGYASTLDGRINFESTSRRKRGFTWKLRRSKRK